MILKSQLIYSPHGPAIKNHGEYILFHSDKTEHAFYFFKTILSNVRLAIAKQLEIDEDFETAQT